MVVPKSVKFRNPGPRENGYESHHTAKAVVLTERSRKPKEATVFPASSPDQ